MYLLYIDICWVIVSADHKHLEVKITTMVNTPFGIDQEIFQYETIILEHGTLSVLDYFFHQL